MGFKAFFKKFGQIALLEAPAIAAAAGLPPELGPAVAIGITAAKGMKGANNLTKADEAAKIAKLILASTNQILVSQGHPPLVDEAISDDALNALIKATYDVAKMKDAATTPVALNP